MKKRKNALTTILALLVLGIGAATSLSSFRESTSSLYAGVVTETSSDGSTDDNGQPLFDTPVAHPVSCAASTITYTSYYSGDKLIYTKYSNGKITGDAGAKDVITTTLTGSTTIPAFNTSWIECKPKLGLGCTPCTPNLACTMGCDN